MEEEDVSKVKYKLFTKRQKQRFFEKRSIVQENYEDFVKQIKARLGSNAAVFKNGSKIKYLHRMIKIYLNFSAMMDLTVLFLALTAYEYEFDRTKDSGAAEVLYIMLSVLTLVNVVVSWMEDRLDKQLDKEIRGALAKTGGSWDTFMAILFKICSVYFLIFDL